MTVADREKLADFITTHPELTYHQCAKVHACSFQTIARIAQEFGVRRKTGRKPPVALEGTTPSL